MFFIPENKSLKEARPLRRQEMNLDLTVDIEHPKSKEQIR